MHISKYDLPLQTTKTFNPSRTLDIPLQSSSSKLVFKHQRRKQTRRTTPPNPYIQKPTIAEAIDVSPFDLDLSNPTLHQEVLNNITCLSSTKTLLDYNYELLQELDLERTLVVKLLESIGEIPASDRDPCPYWGCTCSQKQKKKEQMKINEPKSNSSTQTLSIPKIDPDPEPPANKKLADYTTIDLGFLHQTINCKTWHTPTITNEKVSEDYECDLCRVGFTTQNTERSLILRMNWSISGQSVQLPEKLKPRPPSATNPSAKNSSSRSPSPFRFIHRPNDGNLTDRPSLRRRHVTPPRQIVPRHPVQSKSCQTDALSVQVEVVTPGGQKFEFKNSQHVHFTKFILPQFDATISPDKNELHSLLQNFNIPGELGTLGPVQFDPDVRRSEATPLKTQKEVRKVPNTPNFQSSFLFTVDGSFDSSPQNVKIDENVSTIQRSNSNLEVSFTENPDVSQPAEETSQHHLVEATMKIKRAGKLLDKDIENTLSEQLRSTIGRNSVEDHFEHFIGSYSRHVRTLIRGVVQFLPEHATCFEKLFKAWVLLWDSLISKINFKLQDMEYQIDDYAEKNQDRLELKAKIFELQKESASSKDKYENRIASLNRIISKYESMINLYRKELDGSIEEPKASSATKLLRKMKEKTTGVKLLSTVMNPYPKTSDT